MYQVIIADDDQWIRKGLTKAVCWEQLGFEVAASVSCGKDALDYLKEHVADVILTDINMPEMSGLELIAQAKICCPAIRSVIISGYSEFEYARSAIDLKVESYLLKPLSPEDIARVFTNIKKALDDIHSARSDGRQAFNGGQASDDGQAFGGSRVSGGSQALNSGQASDDGQAFSGSRASGGSQALNGSRASGGSQASDGGGNGTGMAGDSMSSLLVNQALLAIRDSYGDKSLSLASLSNKLNVSYGYLSSIFVKNIGKSFKTCLVEVRMEKARELLMLRKYKIYEIADMVGYRSPRYFTDAFKKYFGISPVDYLIHLQVNERT